MQTSPIIMHHANPSRLLLASAVFFLPTTNHLAVVAVVVAVVAHILVFSDAVRLFAMTLPSAPSAESSPRYTSGADKLPSKEPALGIGSSSAGPPPKKEKDWLFHSKFKSFFRLSHRGHHSSHAAATDGNQEGNDSDNSHSHSQSPKQHDSASSSSAFNTVKSSTFSLQNRLMPYITRNRSATTASEGHHLLEDDSSISPIAHANPYFKHQGHPIYRHQNDGLQTPQKGSLGNTTPSSSHQNAGAEATAHETTDIAHQSPTLTVNIADDEEQLTAADVAAAETANAGNKEQLVRKLRRVASAPTTQALFRDDDDDDTDCEDGRLGVGAAKQRKTGSKTELLPQEPFSITAPELDPANRNAEQTTDSSDELIPELRSLKTAISAPDTDENAPPLKMDKSRASSTGGRLRRLYGNSSTKVRNVEVGPGDFDKVKLIGKGDVGKVYLVREHKSDRLYAMKGRLTCYSVMVCQYLQYGGMLILELLSFSARQKRNDQTEQDQTCSCRAGNSRHEQSSFHRYVVPLLPIGILFVLMHGVLQWWRVFQRYSSLTIRCSALPGCIFT